MNGLGSLMPLLSATETGYVITFSPELFPQIIIHMVTALVLFYVLYRLLFKPVRGILDKRSEEIASEYQRIEEDTEAVASLKTEYEGKLQNINKEADQILAHARKRAVEREDEIIKEAKDEADRIMKRANLEIMREKEQMKDEMRREIIEVATVMASKFVAASISEDQKDALVNETLSGMGESTWLN